MVQVIVVQNIGRLLNLETSCDICKLEFVSTPTNELQHIEIDCEVELLMTILWCLCPRVDHKD